MVEYSRSDSPMNIASSHNRTRMTNHTPEKTSELAEAASEISESMRKCKGMNRELQMQKLFFNFHNVSSHKFVNNNNRAEVRRLYYRSTHTTLLNRKSHTLSHPINAGQITRFNHEALIRHRSYGRSNRITSSFQFLSISAFDPVVMKYHFALCSVLSFLRGYPLHSSHLSPLKDSGYMVYTSRCDSPTGLSPIPLERVRNRIRNICMTIDMKSRHDVHTTTQIARRNGRIPGWMYKRQENGWECYSQQSQLEITMDSRLERDFNLKVKI